MERYALKSLGMILFVTFMASIITGPNEALAEKKGSAFAKQFQGNWAVVSVVNEQDGKRVSHLVLIRLAR